MSEQWNTIGQKNTSHGCLNYFLVGISSSLEALWFSFFSRQYYEKEKDKLLDYWSPTEKRKRAIQRIMDDLGTPKYSAARRKVTQLTQINTHETNINNDHNCSSSKSKKKLSRFDVLPNQKWRNLKLPPIDEINYPHWAHQSKYSISVLSKFQ